MNDVESFIDEERINSVLDRTKNPDMEEVRRILKKALELKGLELEETATLLNITAEDDSMLKELFDTALQIKEEIYGNRLVLFTPLYVSSHCTNNCEYCGFRRDNVDMDRRCLSTDEVREEVRIILEQGHKRVLMLMGEDEFQCSFEHFLKTIDAAYSVADSKGNSLRRINVEIAPLTEEQFRRLAQVKIGTYTMFQETYHRRTYERMHPSGRKADYDWRLQTMDRALMSGLHDIGIGALFGLYDYRFEVLALIQHARHLDEKFGVGPHTISIPRIERAQNAPAALSPPHPVSDADFKKLVAVLRCSVPYTGMILSTRESPEMRQEVFDMGVSQISAGSRTNPGGYGKAGSDAILEKSGQFGLSDTRPPREVIKSMIEQGFIPSFCTACYRLGRVGKDFMDLAKPGLIKLHCLPNSLTTLKEYLVDYADEETKRLGNELIERKLNEIPDRAVREKTIEYLKRIEQGERDLYF
jgi:2-iminoacetate synthase